MAWETIKTHVFAPGRLRDMHTNRLFLVLLLATFCFSEDVKVDRSSAVTASDSAVNVTLREGSARLIGPSGRCGLTLALAGGHVELNKGIMSISSPDDFKAICSQPGVHPSEIHIVKSISVCSIQHLPSTVEGCSIAGCSVVRWRGATDVGESLWMHEQGHARCLIHRSGAQLLMDPSLKPDQFKLDTEECCKMKAGCPPNTEPADEQIEEDTPEEAKEAVETFVSRRYIHGLPFKQAALYSPEEVNKVIPWLKPCRPEDNACKLCAKNECWTNIVLLIGLAGAPDEQSRGALVDFLKLAVSDFDVAYQAKLAVPLALGYLIHRPPNTEKPHTALEPAETIKIEVLQLLNAGTHFQHWIDIGAKLGPGDLDKESAIELAKQSILGLGVSGTSKADEILQQLLKCSDLQNLNNKPHDGCDEFLGKTPARNLIIYGRDLNARQQRQKNAR